jgi:hypothetical protein
MNTPAASIDELNFHLTKVVLAELSGKTLEANQWLG